MQMINEIRKLSKNIIEHSNCHVVLNEENIEKLAESLKSNEASSWAEQPSDLTIQEIFLYELIANSVNYCYWYGRGNIRPNKSSANTMYRLLDESFKESRDRSDEKDIIDIFYCKIKENRFPLLKEREYHLKELLYVYNKITKRGHELYCGIKEFYEYSETHNFDMLKAIDFVFSNYNGYAEDLFLKRLQLLMMQIYRKTGKFADQIHLLTVPADYQIPKILRHYKCIRYHPDLEDMVDAEIIIPKGSAYEVEIRAATIIACDKIAELSKTNNVIVDNFLWQSRKLSNKPFHLTVTTDY